MCKFKKMKIQIGMIFPVGTVNRIPSIVGVGSTQNINLGFDCRLLHSFLLAQYIGQHWTYVHIWRIFIQRRAR
jgi:hypothetical protein